MRDGIQSWRPRQSAFRFDPKRGEKKPQKQEGDDDTQHNENSVTEVPPAIVAFKYLYFFLECHRGQ